jgi:hypothetical protein
LLPEQEGAAVISVGLSIREYGGYVVVALDGELDVSDAVSVADALTSVAARDARIIVDLAALEFIDCCALGAGGRAHLPSAAGWILRSAGYARQGGGSVGHSSLVPRSWPCAC